jgi:hypothetical protein
VFGLPRLVFADSSLASFPGCPLSVAPWLAFGTILSYSFKIHILLDTIGYTDSIITIYISHAKLHRRYYNRKKLKIKKVIFFKSIRKS